VPPISGQSIVISVYVCLSLHSFILKPHAQMSPNFLYMLPVAVARSSSDSKCNTLCTSGFVDDVMFSHIGTNGPESKTTRMFR